MGLHNPREVTLQLSSASQRQGCPNEHPQSAPELIGQAQDAPPQDVVVNGQWDAADNIIFIFHSPEPIVAPLINIIHLQDRPLEMETVSERPDMPLEEDILSKCPAVGCPNSRQARFENAIKESSEPQLINSVAALIQVQLAGCSTSDEFRQQVPKDLPDKLLVVVAEERHAYNVVNKTIGTRPPELLPAVLLQVLICCPEFDGHEPIPCPEFNGHKPSSSFIEGEGWLNKSVVNKINAWSIDERSPNMLETTVG